MSWREKLEALRSRIFGDRSSPAEQSSDAGTSHSADSKAGPLQRASAPSAVKRVAPRIIAINLGIDFGTSFTKVCYRDVGTEESGVVAIGQGLKKALLPSLVTVSRSGHLALSETGACPAASVAINYLKMRLAGTPIGDAFPEVAGVNLNEPDSIKALATWFLASVIARSQVWIRLNETSRLKNRTPVWSANIGVPVEHYDSEALATFEEVLGIAWLWVKDNRIPVTLFDALQEYHTTLGRLVDEVTDFHAIPEIAAAVQSFVMSREAVPGIYVYFDIGGGTVDGVAFNYLNYGGERRINFYSGRVEPLGVSAIGAAINANNGYELDATILESLLKKCSADIHDDYAYRVRRLVAGVIMTAKKKDGRNWQVDAIQNSDYERKFIGQLSPHRMRPLIVFLGGGGSKSAWYSSTISSTYEEFQHDRAGIPPYKIVNVPSPKDFTMRESDGGGFTRFAISYGLSIPFGEGPEIRLPSQFAEPEKPKQWLPPGVINYADSKDVYE
jgi:hypothetical protein